MRRLAAALVAGMAAGGCHALASTGEEPPPQRAVPVADAPQTAASAQIGSPATPEAPTRPPLDPVLACTRCELAPVGKAYALPPSYAPEVVPTGLYGGGLVTPETRDALHALFAAAEAAGHRPRVGSGYRSYAAQRHIFGEYVQNEIAAGLTREQAEAKANTYSARPGHSEHQLGTTADLVTCSRPCSYRAASNRPWYAFLQEHAHRHGFVVSYPDGSQPWTGYIHEPWHVRYVGVELATELHASGYLTRPDHNLQDVLLDRGAW